MRCVGQVSRLAATCISSTHLHTFVPANAPKNRPFVPNHNPLNVGKPYPTRMPRVANTISAMATSQHPGPTAANEKKPPKGFGKSSAKPSSSPAGGSSTRKPSSKRKKKPTPEQQDLAAAMKYAKGRQQPPPIDPVMAAKGRVDRVKVKHWGSGKPEDLGELEIDDQERIEGENAGEVLEGPLYQALGKMLEQLQKQGALRIATPEGAPPTPPIQSWSFTVPRYTQYLVDQAAVHTALENSLHAVVNGQTPVDVGQQPPSMTMSGGGGNDTGHAHTATGHTHDDSTLDESNKGNAAESTGSAKDKNIPKNIPKDKIIHTDTSAISQPMPSTTVTAAAGALRVFFPTAVTLTRSLDAMRDLSAIACAMPEGGAVHVQPTQQAASHADLLTQFARRGVDEEVSAPARERACCQLLCHAYALYVTQLTSSMRLGSLANSKLKLDAIGALHFFTNYPVDNPLSAFTQGLDDAGAGLSVEARQKMLDELPRAFKHASMLMASLAHTD